MATGTNAIATELEVKDITGSSAAVTLNLCCKKARAVVLGANSSYLTSYSDNLLVKYSDIKKITYYSTTTNFPNVLFGAVFVKPSGYSDDLFYIKITTIVSYDQYSATKETDIKLHPSSSTSNSLDVPDGYIGIDSGINILNGDGHVANTSYEVLPSLTYTYPSNNPPTTFTCNVSISLYAMSSGSGSSGDVLLKSIDTTVTSISIHSEHTLIYDYATFTYNGPNYSQGSISSNSYYYDTHILFDSLSTRNTMYEYWGCEEI